MQRVYRITFKKIYDARNKCARMKSNNLKINDGYAYHLKKQLNIPINEFHYGIHNRAAILYENDKLITFFLEIMCILILFYHSYVNYIFINYGYFFWLEY